MTNRSISARRSRVHAHERPQRVHVRVDGKRPAKENLLNCRAHLLQQTPPHRDPPFAAGERLGNLRHAHAVDRHQIDDEPGLLQNVQAPVRRSPHQIQNAGGLLLAQRHVGNAVDPQLLGAAATLETVQQQAAFGRVHAFQRLFDAPLGDRRQQARFASVVPQAMPLIPQVQARQFHDFAHRTLPTAGVRSQNRERNRSCCRAPMLCCLIASPKQVKNFAATEFDAFNQAYDHPHVGQHRRCGHTRLVEHHAFQPQRDRRCVADGRDAGAPACGSRVRRRLQIRDRLCACACRTCCRRALRRFFLRLPATVR